MTFDPRTAKPFDPNTATPVAFDPTTAKPFDPSTATEVKTQEPSFSQTVFGENSPYGLFQKGIKESIPSPGRPYGNPAAGLGNVAAGILTAPFLPFNAAAYGAKDIPVVGGPLSNALGFIGSIPSTLARTGGDIIHGGLNAVGVPQSVQNLGLPQKMANEVSEGLGNMNQATSNYLVPPILGKTAVAGVKAGANQVANVQGRMTGLGKGFAEQAFKGGDAFKEQMRGNGIPPEGIVGIAKDALQSIRDDRGAAYRAKLEDFSQNATPMDKSALLSKMNDALNKYGVKMDENHNIIRSTFDRSEVGKVQQIVEMVNDWGSQPGDLTPAGFDMLKRNLDDFYSPSKNSRAFVSDLRNAVKDELVQKVPQYNEMVQPYAQATDLIDQIQSTLSMGNKSSANTTLTRLNQAMREDPGLKLELANQLDKRSGGELMQRIAGQQASSLVPNTRLGHAASAGAGIVLTAILSHEPGLYGILAAGSPRLVGEFNSLMGDGWRALQSIRQPKSAMISTADMPPYRSAPPDATGGGGFPPFQPKGPVAPQGGLPNFKSTEDAMAFGKSNPDAAPLLNQRRQQSLDQVKELMKQKNADAALRMAVKAQLDREAVEAMNQNPSPGSR